MSMKSRGLHYYVTEERKKETGFGPAAGKAIKLHTLKLLPGSLAMALSWGLLPMSRSFLDPGSLHPIQLGPFLALGQQASFLINFQTHFFFFFIRCLQKRPIRTFSVLFITRKGGEGGGKGVVQHNVGQVSEISPSPYRVSTQVCKPRFLRS